MKAGRAYYREVLHSIFVYMLHEQEDRATTLAMIRDALHEAEGDTRRRKLSRDPNAAIVFGAIFYRWFRDPGYLNRKAEPRALTLRGKRESVESLLRAEKIRGRTLENFLSEVLRLQLVRKTSRSRYVPVAQVALFRRDGAALIHHIGASFTRLMSTFNYNTRRENRKSPLVERAASIANLPKSEIKAFREFTQRQANSFLASVDDWLESHKSNSRSKKRRDQCRPAGVHVYTYLCS